MKSNSSFSTTGRGSLTTCDDKLLFVTICQRPLFEMARAMRAWWELCATVCQHFVTLCVGRAGTRLRAPAPSSLILPCVTYLYAFAVTQYVCLTNAFKDTRRPVAKKSSEVKCVLITLVQSSRSTSQLTTPAHFVADRHPTRFSVSFPVNGIHSGRPLQPSRPCPACYAVGGLNERSAGCARRTPMKTEQTILVEILSSA